MVETDASTHINHWLLLYNNYKSKERNNVIGMNWQNPVIYIEAGFKTVLSGDIINAPINIGDQVFIYQGGYKLIRGIYGIGIVQDILTSKRHYNENYAVITLKYQGQKDKPVVYYYDNARAILYNRILAARRKGYSQLSDNDVKIIKDCIK